MTSSSGPRLRADLDAIPGYKAGQKPTVRTDITSYKLSSNENHFPPLPGVVDAVTAALQEMHRYPDFASTELVEALASRFDVPAAHVTVGTGSVALVQQLVQITSAPGDGVLYGWRSFESYPITTKVAGAAAQQVPLDSDDRYDLRAMLGAIDDTTRLVFVCNPNNPTSTAVGHEALAEFVVAVPSDVLVVIDEAYREFVDPGTVPDGLDFYREHENVAVLRTFSKAYGLAGLRVGFCIAHDAVSEAMRKVATPFGVSTAAQVAAVASLQVEDELFARVESIREQRVAVDGALRAAGFALAESEANFLWLRLGEDTSSFAAACDEAGVSVRPFAGEGVRISIGEPEANERLVATATTWLASR